MRTKITVLSLLLMLGCGVDHNISSIKTEGGVTVDIPKDYTITQRIDILGTWEQLKQVCRDVYSEEQEKLTLCEEKMIEMFATNSNLDKPKKQGKE